MGGQLHRHALVTSTIPDIDFGHQFKSDHKIGWTGNVLCNERLINKTCYPSGSLIFGRHYF
jgi:hypothetical protein